MVIHNHVSCLGHHDSWDTRHEALEVENLIGRQLGMTIMLNEQL